MKTNKVNWLQIIEIALCIGAIIFLIVMFVRVCHNANVFYQTEMTHPENADLEILVIHARNQRIASAFIALAVVFVPLLAFSVVSLFVNHDHNGMDKIFVGVYALIVGAFLIVWLCSLDKTSNDYFAWSLNYAFRSAIGLYVY